jgi:hypothetical protein
MAAAAVKRSADVRQPTAACSYACSPLSGPISAEAPTPPRPVASCPPLRPAPAQLSPGPSRGAVHVRSPPSCARAPLRAPACWVPRGPARGPAARLGPGPGPPRPCARSRPPGGETEQRALQDETRAEAEAEDGAGGGTRRRSSRRPSQRSAQRDAGAPVCASGDVATARVAPWQCGCGARGPRCAAEAPHRQGCMSVRPQPGAARRRHAARSPRQRRRPRRAAGPPQRRPAFPGHPPTQGSRMARRRGARAHTHRRTHDARHPRCPGQAPSSAPFTCWGQGAGTLHPAQELAAALTIASARPPSSACSGSPPLGTSAAAAAAPGAAGGLTCSGAGSRGVSVTPASRR